MSANASASIIGLIADNLIDVIRGRMRPARLLNTQTRSPRRQQLETAPETVPLVVRLDRLDV